MDAIVGVDVITYPCYKLDAVFTDAMAAVYAYMISNSS